MNPEKMNLTDLISLRTALDAAAKAGKIMEDAGLAPVFAVSAYTPLMTVPPIGDLKSAEVDRLAELLSPAPTLTQTPTGCLPGITAAPYAPGPRQAKTERPAPICKDGPREREAPAAEVTHAAEEPASDAQAETLAASDQPAASAPFTAEPAPMTAPPFDPARPGHYTADQQEWAISTFLDLTDAGIPSPEVYARIGKALDRSGEAIRQRMMTAWKSRLQDARDSRAKAKAKPVAAQPLVTAPKVEPAPAPATPAKSIYEDPLVQRISALKLPYGWDYGADFRALTLATQGLDNSTIAANLEVPPKVVASRIAALTNGGMYPVAELLKAITAILDDQRKGKAA